MWTALIHRYIVPIDEFCRKQREGVLPAFGWIFSKSRSDVESRRPAVKRSSFPALLQKTAEVDHMTMSSLANTGWPWKPQYFTFLIFAAWVCPGRIDLQSAIYWGLSVYQGGFDPAQSVCLRATIATPYQPCHGDTWKPQYFTVFLFVFLVFLILYLGQLMCPFAFLRFPSSSVEPACNHVCQLSAKCIWSQLHSACHLMSVPD